MHPFAYHRPTSLADAAAVLAGSANGKLLAGGQTLIRALAQRRARAADLIDLAAVPSLVGVTISDGRISVGAMTTHAGIVAAAEVRQTIPVLAELALGIGDPAVRNRGTIGGAIAHNDPVGDYPAVCLGLGGHIVTNCRRIAAAEFFTRPYETPLMRDEIVVAVDFPTACRAAYAKLADPASRGAVAGVLVAETSEGLRVAVTGAARAGVFLWREAEATLTRGFDPSALDSLSLDAALMLDDVRGAALYRADLARVLAKRAVRDMIAASTN